MDANKRALCVVCPLPADRSYQGSPRERKNITVCVVCVFLMTGSRCVYAVVCPLL